MGINKDQVKGRAEEAQGKVKEVVGHAVGNKDLEARGKMQKDIGAARGKLGDVKEDIKKTVDSI
jgi:uncharacterized protein YjbJ (UPF0337 family)